MGGGRGGEVVGEGGSVSPCLSCLSPSIQVWEEGGVESEGSEAPTHSGPLPTPAPHSLEWCPISWWCLAPPPTCQSSSPGRLRAPRGQHPLIKPYLQPGWPGTPPSRVSLRPLENYPPPPNSTPTPHPLTKHTQSHSSLDSLSYFRKELDLTLPPACHPGNFLSVHTPAWSLEAGPHKALTSRPPGWAGSGKNWEGPWCWRRLLRVLWTARRSNESILKEISPEYSLEGLLL